MLKSSIADVLKGTGFQNQHFNQNGYCMFSQINQKAEGCGKLYGFSDSFRPTSAPASGAKRTRPAFSHCLIELLTPGKKELYQWEQAPLTQWPELSVTGVLDLIMPRFIRTRYFLLFSSFWVGHAAGGRILCRCWTWTVCVLFILLYSVCRRL